MNKVLSPAQREIVRVAMAILSKKATKVRKLEEALALSTSSTDALLLRVELVLDAIGGRAEAPVYLTYALRQTLRHGLDLYLEEVEGTAEDEATLGIDTRGSDKLALSIKQLHALVADQHTLSAEIAGVDTADDDAIDDAIVDEAHAEAGDEAEDEMEVAET